MGDNMKIDIKTRLKNKTFLLGFTGSIVTFVYQMLGMFDVVPTISQDQIINLTSIVINILVGLAVVVDPTTEGISDGK